MNRFQNFRSRHLIISVALLLISTFAHQTLMVQGRSMPNSAEVFQWRSKGREGSFRERRLLGSRPPRCARRCSSCSHCEAIQVPIAHLQVQQKPTGISQTLNSRGDDLSNYKPMSWRCKCGNLIFKP